ncbi:hypothetical protein BD324DRAFT_653783 [Kockovaella imperatae]|uniref:CCHC-type domain-containing protein n=1 Tax=Kockovaella imperatae TaxID=4999 RepID=A0A1Y1U8A0_9TREE|nr:hypothetical protein BD324DRAFT_653783 [Kockovaella imperatae]ORX33727.1 hypothetical protein BD324DRAFT_653783 [Kockovaella imperatae]
MTRITSFNLPKKTFVSSRAEETGDSTAGPSNIKAQLQGPGADQPKKKSKRRGRRGKEDVAVTQHDSASSGSKPSVSQGGAGWKRDRSIAKRARFAAERAEERRLNRQKQKNSSTTCFACRSVGHTARDCPNILLATEGPQGTAELLGDISAKVDSETKAGGSVSDGGTKGLKRKKGKLGADLVGNRCYRCDSTGHSLSLCPEPMDLENPTPFATCYICLGRGHLSSLCPNNAGKGIYVNGGSCKVCGSTDHRAKDCPDAPVKDSESSGDTRRGGPKTNRDLVIGVQGGPDEDDWMVQSRVQGPSQTGDKSKGSSWPKAKPTNPHSSRAALQDIKRDQLQDLSDPIEPAPGPTTTASPARPVKSKVKVVKF